MKKNIPSQNQAIGLKSSYQTFLKSLFTAFLLLCSMGVWGQIAIPNTTAVTQNFDGMGTTTTLPASWRMAASTASPTWTAASTTVTQQGSSGTPASGGTYNFGSSTTERAVGAMTSGSFGSPNNLLAFYQNTNASNLTSLTISYDAERYRINTAAASVQFYYSLNGTVWTAVTTGDIAAASFPTGVNAYNFATGTVIYKTGISITGLNIATSGNIYIRWNVDTAGVNSQGIAIDNVSVTAGFAAAAITSNAVSGNWSATSSWVGGIVPTSAVNAIIVSGAVITMDDDAYATRNAGTTTIVNTGGTLATAKTYVNNGATTITGSFQLNSSGWVSDAIGTNPLVYGTGGSGGTLIFNTPYTANSGNYWPTTSGPVNVTVNTSNNLDLGFARTVTGLFQTSSNINNPGNITANGTLQLNAGYGWSGTGSPIYGPASLLKYNSGGTPGRGIEWNQSSGIIGSTAGYPQDVQLSGSTTLNYPNGTSGTFKTNGNLTIDSGSELYQNYSGANASLIVGGDLLLNGKLGLGSTTGADISVAGNWTQSIAANFYPNSRTVFFNGSTAQTIQKTGGGAIDFDLIEIYKTNGTNVSISSSIGNLTDINVNGTSGNVFALKGSGSGTIDLKGRALTFNNNGGFIYVDATKSMSTSVSSGATVNFTGSKVIANNGGTGILLFPVNVTINLNSNGVVDFGSSSSSISTVDGILNINSNVNSYINANAPIYGSASKIVYKSGGTYSRRNEWTATFGAGYPNDIQVTNNTTLDVPSTGGTFTTNLALARDLTIDFGSALYMDYGAGAASGSLTVGRNAVIAGSLSLGDTFGGDMSVGGNWTRTGTFTHNGRLVTFNGGSAQTLTGATTFDNLTLSNSTGLTLQASSAVTVNKTLALTSGKLTLGANNLTIGSTGMVSGGSSTNYIVTNGVGQLKQTVAASSISFPIGRSTSSYTPISVTNSGTSDIYGFRTVAGVTDATDLTIMVQNSWYASEAVGGGGNIRVQPQWNSGDEGSSFTNTDNFIELYSPAITSYPATVSSQTAVLTNAGDNFSNSLSGAEYFSVSSRGKPIITSSLTANAYQTVAFSYQIVATNSPTSYNATSLPTGLSINTSTGEISGTTTVATGNYSVTISATNSGGTDTKTLVITVGAPPCLSQVNFTSKPTGWTDTNITYTSNEAVFGSNTGELATIALSNPASLTFDLRRSSNATAKTLYVEVSTTTQGGTYTTIATYDHSNTTSSATTYCTVDLSAYTSYSTVYIKFRKASSTASPWYLKNVNVLCGTPPTKKYYQSRGTGGNWGNVSSWDSSTDNVSFGASTTIPSKNNANSIIILNGAKITIGTSGVSMTATTVKSGGTLEITTSSSFDLSGVADGIELTVENNGVFLVNSADTFSSPTGNAYGLIKTGGKLVAGPNMGSALTGTSTKTGTDFANSYLGYNNGIFYFDDKAICEWLSGYTVLGSSSPTDSDFFFPITPTAMPIFRISTNPAFGFGANTTSNIFYAVLEVNANFSLTGGGSKTFNGGVQGTSTVTQNTSSGKFILGNGTNIPTIGGSVTLNVLTASLQLPNGANVPLNATPTIASTLENNSINRQGGNLTVDGTLDITNMRITNTASGGVVVNGTLRTANTGGLSGIGSAIVEDGPKLSINDNSTIEYYATADQLISSSPNYYNITFSGAGTKTTQGPIAVADYGSVKITGTPIIKATSNLASVVLNHTLFTMDGGRLILSTGGTQPNMQGSYALTGGVIEFAGGSSTQIRVGSSAIPYLNVEVSGTNVSAGTTSTAGLTFKSGGTFKVNANGLFKVNNAQGFSGTPASAIKSTNSPSIILEPSSTVEYNGLTQIISQGVLTSPTDANYQNLIISGDDVTQDEKDLTVNETTTVSSISPKVAKLTIPGTSDFKDSYVLTAKKGLFVNGTAVALFKSGAQLMQNKNIVNTGNITMERSANVPSAQYNYWSSPVNNQVLYDLYPNIPWNRVMVYNTATDFFTILPKAGNPTSEFGKGYSIKGPTTGGGAITASFVGVPNNESATATNNEIPLAKSGNRYNLIGNPFPSNLDITKIYNDNTLQFESTENTFYFWDNVSNTDLVQLGSGYTSQNNYALYNPLSGMGTPAPNTSGSGKEPIANIKPGQGFIMRASSTATKLILANTMRTSALGGKGVYYKGANDSDKFWLQLTTPENMRIVIAAGYFQNAENTFEPYDSPIFDEGVTENFYSLSTDNKKLNIQARKGAFDILDVIPLTAKIHLNGNAKISLYKKEGVFENDQMIYLHDKLNNIYTNLNEGFYTFAAIAGNIENRFEIVFKPGSVLSTGENIKDDLQVYRSGDEFIVQSGKGVIQEVEVFDASGRMFQKVKGGTNKITVNAATLVSGMYILKIKRNGEIVSKKIMK